MSGITSLVDTLLATRLAQRVDLLPLRSQVSIPGPEAVAGVEAITNDVRLPSRAALDRRLDLGLSGGGDESAAAPTAGPERGLTLSSVARAIGAILGTPDNSGSKLKLQGTQPLWAFSRPPPAHLMAASLADTVAISGLFYESHLQQFVAGARPLEQLMREPQAVLEPADQSAEPAGESQATRPAAVEAQGRPVHPSTVYDRDGSAGSRSMRFHEVAGEVAADTVSPADGRGAHLPGPVASSIHPDAMALVRQQLDLLDVPVFRWCGEAWTGATLDWEIHEEPREPGPGSDEAPQSAWTTHLTMTLPALRALAVRLTLMGNTLQLSLTSSHEPGLPTLAAGRQALSDRLEGLGLRLTSLQIDTDNGLASTEPVAHSGPPDARHD